MQSLYSKKDQSFSPTTGTPVPGRKGTITKWAPGGPYPNITHTPVSSSGFLNLGSSLQITSTGRPIRVRANLSAQIYDQTTQQTGAAQYTFAVTRVDLPIVYISESIKAGLVCLNKIYSLGSINDYAGNQQSDQIDFTDPNPTADGQIYEYQLIVRCGFFSYQSNSATIKLATSAYGFEIEEVV